MVLSPSLAEHLLFQPSRGDPGPPPLLQGVQGEDHTLTTQDGVEIKAWWYPAESTVESPAVGPAVLLLHGNAGDIAGRTPLAEGLLSEGVSVLLLEYRGYGGSKGRPSEEGLHLDALAGWDFLLERVADPNRITVLGRSMGGAVAARLAANRTPGALVLESAFTSLAEMGKSVYPFLPRFLLVRLEEAFATRRWVRDAKAPLLVIHGSEDQLVPLSMGREIYEAGKDPKEWFLVPGAGHNDVFWIGGGEYFRRIAEIARRGPGHTPVSDQAPKKDGPAPRT